MDLANFLQCYNRGCGLKYDPNNNNAGKFSILRRMELKSCFNMISYYCTFREL